MVWFRRLIKILMGILTALLVGMIGLWLWLGQRRPERAEEGPAAEALAKRLEASVNPEAWARTGAITWTHAGRNKHLWDRVRNFDHVRFNDGTEVWIDLNTKLGHVERNGQVLEGAEKNKALGEAHRWWVNDSFWLSPLTKLFDAGVTRKHVPVIEGDPAGSEGLFLEYGKGGVTPGDSYLWIAPKDGPPLAWRMWVSVLPIGGMRVSFEEWKELETGVRVATLHDLGGFKFRLTELKAGAQLADLAPGPDPFARLLPGAPSSAPASAPAP